MKRVDVTTAIDITRPNTHDSNSTEITHHRRQGVPEDY
jgi:hypothetical protein